ncbi:hypothetical protein UB46_21700 [Burkholderiaceae bacterium 16]|nr:hypothetical protein UB46_21700 [Burkholderiaceae bacterium 16]
MKPEFSLLQMRDVWIDAYKYGDIDQLDFVQSAHFFVKRGEMILTKQQQLGHIRTRVAANAWRADELNAHDETKDVMEHAEWATISGTGSMRQNGRVLSRFRFLELWLVSDGRWQVAALCYEDAGNRETSS